MNRTPPHLVVIGGGAAGFFCAVNAARLCPGLQVTIVEKTGKLLQKVKVSGGGRCNVTHEPSGIAEMSKAYPRGRLWMKKLLGRFSAEDTVEWFSRRGVILKTESDGRMFPETDSSQTIIDCLLKEAAAYGVEFCLHFSVTDMEYTGSGWQVHSFGRSLQADWVCVACGGLSRPDMYDYLIKATGHTIIPPVPSIFTFQIPAHELTTLMGVSCTASVKIAGLPWSIEGPVLITHWGLSGPAVLRLSAFAARDLADRNYEALVVVNWLPGYNEHTLLQKIRDCRQHEGGKWVRQADWVRLPARLWQWLRTESGISDQTRWGDLTAVQQNRLVKQLCGFECHMKGKTTFKEEFVTAGGIETAEMSSATMESKLRPGLFFAGEILNVDGITGGYNFQHAWASGFVAATGVAALFGKDMPASVGEN